METTGKGLGEYDAEIWARSGFFLEEGDSLASQRVLVYGNGQWEVLKAILMMVWLRGMLSAKGKAPSSPIELDSRNKARRYSG